MSPTKMWIDNAWVDALGRRHPRGDQPGRRHCHRARARGDGADVSRAVAAARRAFDDGPWPRMTARDRGTLLFRVAEAIRARATELAEMDTRNMGKPIVEAEFDVADAAHCFEYYAGLAGKIQGETLPVPDNALSMVVREPMGVVGQIIPWNYPLLMAAWKLAPALAAGCTAVLKPAEQTPLSALMLAGDLPVARPAAGRRQHRDRRRADGWRRPRHRSRVDKIAFTGGSTPASSSSAARLRPSSGCRSSSAAEPEHRVRRCGLRGRGGWRALRGLRESGRGLLCRVTAARRALDLRPDAAGDCRQSRPHHARRSDEPRHEDGAAGHEGAPEKVLGHIEIGRKEGLITGGGRPKDAPCARLGIPSQRSSPT